MAKEKLLAVLAPSLAVLLMVSEIKEQGEIAVTHAARRQGQVWPSLTGH